MYETLLDAVTCAFSRAERTISSCISDLFSYCLFNESYILPNKIC